MRYEFILHKPCQNYEMLLNETLDKFVEQNLIERDFHTIKVIKLMEIVIKLIKFFY